MQDHKSKERFSKRVEDYIKYRPSYPAAIIDTLTNGLRRESKIADIGAGTGIFSRLLLEKGFEVFCSEPNQSMYAAMLDYCGEYQSFHPSLAAAESLDLKDNSIDLITAAQAFHWFDKSKTKKEFKRILTYDGRVALLWNDRVTEGNEFDEEYENFLIRFGTDYQKVNHKQVDEEVISKFLNGGYERYSEKNIQLLNLDGFKGRIMSSSYVPGYGETGHHEMMDAANLLFDRFQYNNNVTITYDCNLYLGYIG